MKVETVIIKVLPGDEPKKVLAATNQYRKFDSRMIAFAKAVSTNNIKANPFEEKGILFFPEVE